MAFLSPSSSSDLWSRRIRRCCFKFIGHLPLTFYGIATRVNNVESAIDRLLNQARRTP
jgi:hypothetical protein